MFTNLLLAVRFLADRKVLDLIDSKYFDKTNPLGPKYIDRHHVDCSKVYALCRDSAEKHVYNGVDIQDVRQDLKERSFKSQDAAYSEIKKIVKQLGDVYSRFIPPDEVAAYALSRLC
eukprot:759431-Hanusia_phi.AAC.2